MRLLNKMRNKPKKLDAIKIQNMEVVCNATMQTMPIIINPPPPPPSPVIAEDGSNKTPSPSVSPRDVDLVLGSKKDISQTKG